MLNLEHILSCLTLKLACLHWCCWILYNIFNLNLFLFLVNQINLLKIFHSHLFPRERSNTAVFFQRIHQMPPRAIDNKQQTSLCLKHANTFLISFTLNDDKTFFNKLSSKYVFTSNKYVRVYQSACQSLKTFRPTLLTRGSAGVLQ